MRETPIVRYEKFSYLFWLNLLKSNIEIVLQSDRLILLAALLRTICRHCDRCDLGDKEAFSALSKVAQKMVRAILSSLLFLAYRLILVLFACIAISSATVCNVDVSIRRTDSAPNRGRSEAVNRLFNCSRNSATQFKKKRGRELRLRDSQIVSTQWLAHSGMFQDVKRRSQTTHMCGCSLFKLKVPTTWKFQASPPCVKSGRCDFRAWKRMPRLFYWFSKLKSKRHCVCLLLFLST